ncbi:MAG: hypothetical protein ABR874_22175 [Candidatus Sulfotelmatobacter sp.]|jgi:hypothetical protein
MVRPASVTVIAALFFLVAGYLIAVGVIDLVSPGTVSLVGGPVTYGRELDGPQTAISVGAGWALVGWGLYRLKNWARWCALAILVIGVAGSVPAVSAAARDLGWRFAWYGLQIMVRIVVAWLLAASPEVVEAFVKK